MKLVFVIKQTSPDVGSLSVEFMEQMSNVLQKMANSEDKTLMPIIALPYGYELQVINLEGDQFNEVTVRYEDANGNEISRKAKWK